MKKLIATALICASGSAFALPVDISTATEMTNTQGNEVSGTATSSPVCSVRENGDAVDLQAFELYFLNGNQYYYSENRGQGTVDIINAGKPDVALSTSFSFGGIKVNQNTMKGYVDYTATLPAGTEGTFEATAQNGGGLAVPGSGITLSATGRTSLSIGDMLISDEGNGFSAVSGEPGITLTVSCTD